MPVENQAHIYKAISGYALNGELIELDVWENAVFKTIKSQIDANNERFLNGCKGGEYGKLGGAPKGNQKTTPKTTQKQPTKKTRVKTAKNKNNPKKTGENYPLRG